MKCAKCQHDGYWFYHRETNERGWGCGECGEEPGEPPGFSPLLDREELESKVRGLLLDLHDEDFLYVSNSDCGERLVAQVAAECRTLGQFDQYTICRLLFAAQSGHGDYWQTVSEGVLSGSDPRNRCPCGALSTCSSLKDGGWEYRCARHVGQEVVFDNG